MTAKSFPDWYNSADNPLHNASDTVKYFTDRALRDAFDAGAAFERALWRGEKREKQNNDNIFS